MLIYVNLCFIGIIEMTFYNLFTKRNLFITAFPLLIMANAFADCSSEGGDDIETCIIIKNATQFPVTTHVVADSNTDNSWTRFEGLKIAPRASVNHTLGQDSRDSRGRPNYQPATIEIQFLNDSNVSIADIGYAMSTNMGSHVNITNTSASKQFSINGVNSNNNIDTTTLSFQPQTEVCNLSNGDLYVWYISSNGTFSDNMQDLATNIIYNDYGNFISAYGTDGFSLNYNPNNKTWELDGTFGSYHGVICK
jgi:uncharacterized protein YqkB